MYLDGTHISLEHFEIKLCGTEKSHINIYAWAFQGKSLIFISTFKKQLNFLPRQFCP